MRSERHHIRTVAGAALLAGLLLTAACGGDGDGPTASGDETTTTEATTASTTTEPTTTSTSTTSTTASTTSTTPRTTARAGVPDIAAFPVGTVATYDDGSSVTVHEVSQPYTDPTSILPPPPNSEIVSAEVEVCAGSRPDTTFNTTAWAAYPADGPVMQSRLAGRLPSFFGAPLSSGSCDRGYVTFVAPIGVSAAWIVWSPEDWEAVRFRV